MESIIISAVGSAKTRHGDADDAFSWQIQFVESFGTDQKCQGGIQTTGNTDYYSLAVSVYQTFGKPCYLDGKNFFTTLIQFFALRNKRMGFYTACKTKIACVNKFCTDVDGGTSRAVADIGGKSGIGQPFTTKTLHVYFTDDQLFLE